MDRLLKVWMVLAFSLGVVAGCGESGGQKVKTVDVSGTVYLDGKPIEGIAVNFFSADHAGYGETGPGGKYQLQNGAEPGENKVHFGMPLGDAADAAGVDPAEMAAATAPGEEGADAAPALDLPFPAKYADSGNAQITFNVPEGGTSSADLKMTSE